LAKFCVNCGNKLIENKKFCSNCGMEVGKVLSTDAKPVIAEKTVVKKNKVLAGVLGICLGWVGAHNFYLGYTAKAVGQLLLTILTCGAGSIISGIWGLIEGIMILTDTITLDGNGNKLED